MYALLRCIYEETLFIRRTLCAPTVSIILNAYLLHLTYFCFLNNRGRTTLTSFSDTVLLKVH